MTSLEAFEPFAGVEDLVNVPFGILVKNPCAIRYVIFKVKLLDNIFHIAGYAAVRIVPNVLKENVLSALVFQKLRFCPHKVKLVLLAVCRPAYRAHAYFHGHGIAQGAVAQAAIVARLRVVFCNCAWLHLYARSLFFAGRVARGFFRRFPAAR